MISPAGNTGTLLHKQINNKQPTSQIKNIKLQKSWRLEHLKLLWLLRVSESLSLDWLSRFLWPHETSFESEQYEIHNSNLDQNLLEINE